MALSPSRDLIVVGYTALAATTVLAGVLQGSVLRRLIAATGSWVLASVGAVAVMCVVVFGAGAIDRDVGWVLGVVAGWIVLGVLQWLVLRAQVAGAGWWVLANTLGLIVAVPMVGFVSWATGAPVDGPLGGLLRWLAFGSAYGSVTGTVLLWLLRQRPELAMP